MDTRKDKTTPRPLTMEEKHEDALNELGNLQNAYKCLKADNLALLEACKDLLACLENETEPHHHRAIKKQAHQAINQATK